MGGARFRGTGYVTVVIVVPSPLSPSHQNP